MKLNRTFQQCKYVRLTTSISAILNYARARVLARVRARVAQEVFAQSVSFGSVVNHNRSNSGSLISARERAVARAQAPPLVLLDYSVSIYFYLLLHARAAHPHHTGTWALALALTAR